MEFGFNDYLLQEYGITADDLTDEDYMAAYDEYQEYISK